MRCLICRTDYAPQSWYDPEEPCACGEMIGDRGSLTWRHRVLSVGWRVLWACGSFDEWLYKKLREAR